MSRTTVGIHDGRWRLSGKITYPGAPAEGLLMNVRMVNAVFEDRNRPSFDPDANTQSCIGRLKEYRDSGVRAITLNFQGGMPGYEGADNSGFAADGSLRTSYRDRVGRVIEGCDRLGMVVILGCFYQRQDQRLRDADAVRRAVTQTADWLAERRYDNVLLEIANEFGHGGFDHRLLRSADGQVELMQVARKRHAKLLISTSDLGHAGVDVTVAKEADYLLIHANGTPVSALPGRIAALQAHAKPIVCNEDQKVGAEGARAAAACVAAGASWGYMNEPVNQRYPFAWRGVADDPEVYAALKRLTT